jgi:hypothetical protein
MRQKKSNEDLKAEIKELESRESAFRAELSRPEIKKLRHVEDVERQWKTYVPQDVIWLPKAENVRGVTSLDDELYVLRDDRDRHQVDVYKKSTNSFLRQLSVPGLGSGRDMTSCKYNQCLYISDGSNECVHRVQLQGQVTKWPVNDSPAGLSVTEKYSVLVTCDKVCKLKLFTTFGVQLRVINLQSGIVKPWHAIELSSGQFVVSHGGWSCVCRVSKVDVSGHILQPYSQSPTGLKLGDPYHLAVDVDEFIFVADPFNYQVLLLSPTLSYVIQVVSRDQLGEEAGPMRLCLDVNSRRLYVAVNDYTNGRVAVVSL